MARRRLIGAGAFALVLATGCAHTDDAELGAQALQRGDDASAIRHLQRAVERDPDDAAAWRDLARAYMRRAEIAAAAPAIDRAAALRPDDPSIVLLRGQIRMNGADRDGARADATWMLAHGQTPSQLEQTAVLLVRLGRAHDALAAATRVVELTSGSAAAYGNLAVLAMQVREPATAERALHDGRARHPDDIELAQTHAAFLLATGRPAQAREVYESLLPRHPQPGIVHQALALLAHEAGDLEVAQRHADAAVQALGDSRASVHYTRVVILHDRGQRGAAIHALNQARRRFPADEDLQRLQAELVPASRR